jgi:AmmeMemoRadiSam system protein B
MFILRASREIKLVPLLVGSVSANKMDRYAEILSEYWKDPETFWVISSDFCHWWVDNVVILASNFQARLVG